MYRIYLDWNVISNLKKRPNEHYVALAELLAIHRKRLWIPYSASHISDLKRGYDANDPNKIRYTYRDLGYILMLTKGNCLVTTIEQSKPRRGWRDPFEYFESLLETQDDDTNTYEGLMTALKMDVSDELPEIANLSATLAQLVEETPMPFPEEGAEVIGQMFPKWKELQTMAGMMQDLLELSERMMRDPAYLQELRAMIDLHMPALNPSIVSSADPVNAFSHIDQLMSPLLGGKSLFAILAPDNNEVSNDRKPKTESEKFTDSYFSLDMFGYRREKLTAKNHFPNILDDMTHAYMAAHCDYFVAEDKTIRAKTAAVYAKEGIRTQILTVEQIVKELTEILTHTYTANNFFEVMSEAIREGVSSDRLLSNVKPDDILADYYYLGWLFLDRFNMIRVERNDNSRLIFQFMELKLTYADSIMTEELDDVVAKLVNCLGVDSKGQALLQRSEWNSFENGLWEGRRWDYKQASLLVRLDAVLGLVFEYLVTETPQESEVLNPIVVETNWIKRLWQKVRN